MPWRPHSPAAERWLRTALGPQARTAQIGLTVIGIGLGAGGSTMDMAGMAYQAMFALPNSREQETEADRIGVELAARVLKPGVRKPRAVAAFRKSAPPNV